MTRNIGELDDWGWQLKKRWILQGRRVELEYHTSTGKWAVYLYNDNSPDTDDWLLYRVKNTERAATDYFEKVTELLR